MDKRDIAPDPEKAAFEITFPNVLRIEVVQLPQLTVDWDSIEPINLEIYPDIADIAVTIEGKPDERKLWRLEIKKTGRLQTVIFKTVSSVYDQMNEPWKNKARREILLAQMVRLTEQFMEKEKFCLPDDWHSSLERKQIAIIRNMSQVVRYIFAAARYQNAEVRELVLDAEQPIKRTGDMVQWSTGRHCEQAMRSHINLAVCDSTLEAKHASILDKHPHVKKWVKNDHIGFHVYYMYAGKVRKYVPDFLVQMESGKMLVIESKGTQTEESKAKRRYLREWTEAVTENGNYGVWEEVLVLPDTDLETVLDEHS